MARMADVQLLTIVAPGLRGRFDAAAAYEPLSGLTASDAAELDALLTRVPAFDELPGRWQAALLRAEATRAGRAPPPPSSCCGGG
jgi:hypothetical protein